MRYYGAIAKPDGKFYVVKILPLGTIEPTEYRSFCTWEEANQVAKDTAAGKYTYKKGEYINMR